MVILLFARQPRGHRCGPPGQRPPSLRPLIAARIWRLRTLAAAHCYATNIGKLPTFIEADWCRKAKGE
jgi:hypothetical protein